MEHKPKVSRYQRNLRSRPDTKIELQFINVEPADREIKSKAKTRTIVRANAAHFHWRHNRPPRKIPGLGRTQLSVDVLDPFESYVCELPTEFASRCITWNAQMLLPSLFPDAADSKNIISNMLQLATLNAPLLHIFIIGALLYSQGALASAPGNSTTLDLFRCRAQLVRDISVAIEDPAEACKDINIFAVSALANKGRRRKLALPVGRTPNQGPLRTLQRIDSYGLTVTDPIHAEGLEKMLELKGGFEKIEMPGLAALISVTELRVATQDTAIPRYPVVTLSCLSTEFKFQHQPSGIGFGFGTDQDVYRAMSMLKSYTIMIGHHCQGHKAIPASVLIDHRNATQHALLSLPPRRGASECCRLAALIYSLLVTFPLPYTAGTFRRLAKQLQAALVEWDGGEKLLIWVLAIGGIGSVGLQERQWFVDRFQEVTMRTGIPSWNQAREIIQQGLWFEATNGRDGVELWLESHDVKA